MVFTASLAGSVLVSAVLAEAFQVPADGADGTGGAGFSFDARFVAISLSL